MSILSGIYPADRGAVRFDGQPAPALGDIGAWRRRIATVFQHSMVVPGLTVAENVFLGRQPPRAGRVDWRGMRAQAAQVMAEWGFAIDVRLPCADLTVEQRQIVEIARALAAGTRCLLLDEPTAALERGAIERLFARVRQLAASGVAILYISHHLEEVFEICQDVAVLRDGELVLTSPVPQLTKDDLVTAMVGGITRDHHPERPRPGTRAGGSHRPAPRRRTLPPDLVVSGVSLTSPGVSLYGVSITVRGGERVGITGLRGSGATTLARIVAGAAAPDAGQVRLCYPGGRPRAPRPGDRAGALRAGIGYIPEDRQAEGSCLARRGGEHRDDDYRADHPRGPGQPQAPRGARGAAGPATVAGSGRARPAGP